MKLINMVLNAITFVFLGYNPEDELKHQLNYAIVRIQQDIPILKR